MYATPCGRRYVRQSNLQSQHMFCPSLHLKSSLRAKLMVWFATRKRYLDSSRLFFCIRGDDARTVQPFSRIVKWHDCNKCKRYVLAPEQNAVLRARYEQTVPNVSVLEWDTVLAVKLAALEYVLRVHCKPSRWIWLECKVPTLIVWTIHHEFVWRRLHDQVHLTLTVCVHSLHDDCRFVTQGVRNDILL